MWRDEETGERMYGEVVEFVTILVEYSTFEELFDWFPEHSIIQRIPVKSNLN